jgi:hypothetical protein
MELDFARERGLWPLFQQGGSQVANDPNEDYKLDGL